MLRSLKAAGVLTVALFCYGEVQAQGLEPFKLYDDFSTEYLDPSRWFGPEQVRVIKGNKLHLMQRNWPLATSNTGAMGFSYNEGLVNPSAITAIKARVKVNALEVSSCAVNAAVGDSRARLNGAFFNVGPGAVAPPNGIGDMFAQLRVIRRSNSTDATGVLRVEGIVQICSEANCSAAQDVGSVELGTVHVGTPVTLEMQWDQPYRRFLFSRDNGRMAGAVYYDNTDSLAPGQPTKSLSTRMVIPNCQSGPRVSGMVDASFDSVFVNSSYALP